MSRAHRLFLQLSGIAITLAIWEVAGRLMGEALLAPPSATAVAYVGLLRDGTMLGELVSSLRQMAVGFAFACAIGIPVGTAMGRVRSVDAAVHPWVSMLMVTSVAAIVPLYILLFGTGFWFRAAVVFTASVGYVVLTTYNGARGIDPRYIDVGRSFSASRLQVFWKVFVPALYPYIFTGVRIGLVHAIRAMVVAEMFIILGYGGLIYQSGLDISTAPLLALLVTIMVVSIGANQLLRIIGDRLAPWYSQRLSAR
jgi:ABC-type nitrate/sulfonate/bicarbonate transport system permease component